jgi:hypothetical protein
VTPTNTVTPSATPLPKIIQDGLVINVNGNPSSYIGTGTTWTSIATGTTYNGDLINGPTWNTGNGGYFSFDGVNDYCYFGDNSKGLDYVSKTFGGWVKTTTSNTDKVFFLRGEEGYEYGGSLGIYKENSTNKFKLFARTGQPGPNGYDKRIESSTTLIDDTWYYVIGVYKYEYNSNQNFISLYINGIQESISNNNISPLLSLNSSSRGWEIARYEGPTYRDVSVGSFELYERDLSDSEILDNFNRRKSIYGY